MEHGDQNGQRAGGNSAEGSFMRMNASTVIAQKANCPLL
jgi:hypothetical protein